MTGKVPLTVKEMFHRASTRYPELKGKVALVTGSNRGIGLGIITRLAAEGMRVIVTGLETEQVIHVADELQNLAVEAIAVPANLQLVDDIAHLFDTLYEHYGQLDLLVNNAADLRRSRLLDMSPELLQSQLELNIRAPILCAQRATHLMKNTGGSIINISSVGGIRAHQRGIPYGMTKGAIDSLTRVLAIDLAEYHIRVNAVAPGISYTERTQERELSQPDAVAELASRNPLQTYGTPLDYGATVAYLASNDANYITGQIVYVDGGLSAQLSLPGYST